MNGTCWNVGLRINFPSTLPTLTAPIGPLNGISEMVRAVEAPIIEVLEERLKGRKSEDEESLRVRLERARLELDYADRFDEVVVNDNLDKAVDTVTALISKFISNT